MPAVPMRIGWTAYCEECQWESFQFNSKEGAAKMSDIHNDDFHKEEP